MGKFDNKVAIVTGGAGSLGTEIIRMLLAESGKVVAFDLPGGQTDRASAEFASDACVFVAGDVTRAADVARLVDSAIDRFGRLDVLVSNAGYFGTIAKLPEYPEDAFDRAYAVNVKGPFLLCKAAATHLEPGASIVIVSSVAGIRGDPGVYGYVAAKHAQVGLMRCLAKELAPRRVRVNTVHPGPIRNGFQDAVERELSPVIGTNATQAFNDMILLGRHAEADEIARAVLYLASDESSFVTGSLLVADGGMSA
ncbi:MAG: SDR family NAD(P)-dependent oxidoreductase [Rhodanobacteraceae bacterium]